MTEPADGDRHAEARFAGRIMQTGYCSWLLLALILLLCMYPLADNSLVWRVVLGLLNSAILITGAVASSPARRTLALGFAFALPALGLQWAHVITHDGTVGLALLVALVLFYIFAIAHVLAFVLRPGPVTGNKLHGAIGTYIMLGLMWAILYTLIDHLVPGAFDYMGDSDLHQPLEWRQFVFFSFVTLTTTGYGDIIPMTAHAQSAAIVEQLAGTFYIAVLIARLAGLYDPGERPHR